MKHANQVRLWRAQQDIAELQAKQEQASTQSELQALNEKLQQRIIESSCAAALRSPVDFRIKEIGFNKPDDLFLNNWGVLISSIIQTPALAVGNSAYTYQDISNISRQPATSYTNSTACQFYSQNYGTQIQFGNSTQAAARNDYAIKTALSSAPENTRFGTGPGAYASNVISFGNIIIAGGSGTINEIGLFHSGQYTIMLTRDILGAGVAFVANNPLVGTFAINI